MDSIDIQTLLYIHKNIKKKFRKKTNYQNGIDHYPALVC